MAIEAGSSVYWQAKRGTVQRGLVGHWDSMAMSSRTGNIVYDLVGNNNGTLTNGVTFERIGMGFDGSNDYIELGANAGNLTETIPFSVSAWALLRETSIYKGIISRSQSVPYAFSLRFNSTTPFLVTDSATITASPVTANQWFHIAVTLEPSLRRIFLNGVLSTENTSAYTVTANNDSLRIGTDYQPGSERVWNGFIEDVRIYNRALSQSEIIQNFNATRYRFGV